MASPVECGYSSLSRTWAGLKRMAFLNTTVSLCAVRLQLLNSGDSQMIKTVRANMSHFCVSYVSTKPNALSVSHWPSPKMQADGAGPHQKQRP